MTSTKYDLNGSQPQWKTTLMDNLNERRPQGKTPSMEGNLHGRQDKWKMTLLEDGINGGKIQWNAT